MGRFRMDFRYQQSIILLLHPECNLVIGRGRRVALTLLVIAYCLIAGAQLFAWLFRTFNIETGHDDHAGKFRIIAQRGIRFEAAPARWFQARTFKIQSAIVGEKYLLRGIQFGKASAS